MTAPVYLIASPGLREGVPRRWNRQRRELGKLLSEATLVSWADLPAAFHDVPPAERPERLAKVLAAAVVVPDKLRNENGRPRRWIGLVAVEEAAAFAAAGKRVEVYAAAGLVPWEECTLVHDANCRPSWTPVEVVLPRFRVNGHGGAQ
jgi:hypothetical protein